MGCDIHLVIEEKTPEGWVGVFASDRVGKRPAIARRDYDFFADLANVRGRGKHYPKNLPRDVSTLAWHLYMRAPTDHHSPSHMALDEFCLLHNQHNPGDSRSEYAVEDLAGIYRDDGEQFRVVFWFDN